MPSPTAPPFAEIPRRDDSLTAFERLRGAIAGGERRRRLWGWLGPLLVTALAALLRLPGLGHPQQLVFDETYYVKDAWSLLHLGYEGTWPAGSDPRFAAGDTMFFTPEASFVVHPPLGKWLIALGLNAFGADSAWGWRIATAVCGILTVLVLVLVTRRLTGSLAWGMLAGVLLAIDGLGIVLSRVALLDGFLAFFLLLAFWLVLIDRERAGLILAARVATAPQRDSGRPSEWGPLIARRPWLAAAGLALGAACAVKWSGVWVLAAFGVYVVVADALDRRRAGLALWPAAAAFRQGPLSFVLLVVPALAAYLASWTGWFVTAGGYDRQSAPEPLIALWNFHAAIYRFHVGLTSPHSYASPAWQWPLMLRPTAMYWKKDEPGVAGCAMPSGCAEAITSIANPVTWYAGMLAIIVLLALFLLSGRRLSRAAGRVRLVGEPHRRSAGTALVLVAFAATYVPWLAYPERTIFQFYTVAMIPFVLMALVLVLRWIARGAPATETARLVAVPVVAPAAPALSWLPTEAALDVAARPDDALTDTEATVDTGSMRRRVGQWSVLALLTLVVVFAAFWMPLWTGMRVPFFFWQLHTPIPGWI